MKRKTSNKAYLMLFIPLLALIIVGCGNEEQIAATFAVETVQAIDEEATAAAPTSTPIPTSTSMLVPTDTPVPTATTEARYIEDDFSSQSEIWGDCQVCEWSNGTVLFGPIPAEGVGVDQLWFVFCNACGEHTYYRVAVDVTYSGGFGSGTFGILAGLNASNVLYAGTVSRNQHALYESFDFNTNSWDDTPFFTYGAVKPGFGTNRIEVTIMPSSSPGNADISVSINGVKVIVLFNRPVEPSTVGLYLGWHSMGILFDNFEYEVLDPVE